MEDNNLTQRARSAPLFHIDIDGVRHAAAAVLAAQSGYSRDYIARLARQGRIDGRQLGSRWYINEKSFQTFCEEQKALREERRLLLIIQTKHQWRAAQSAPDHPL